MDKSKLGIGIQIGGYVVAGGALLRLVWLTITQHPFLVSGIAVGAVCYFVGKALKKQ